MLLGEAPEVLRGLYDERRVVGLLDFLGGGVSVDLRRFENLPSVCVGEMKGESLAEFGFLISGTPFLLGVLSRSLSKAERSGLVLAVLLRARLVTDENDKILLLSSLSAILS